MVYVMYSFYGNGHLNMVYVILNISVSMECLYPSHIEHSENFHALSVLSEIRMGYRLSWQID